MAKVINRSSSRIEVFGDDGGTLKRWVLPARNRSTSSYWQTGPTFDCLAVRGFDGAEIFESDSWFQVFTSEVHVYDWDDESVSLHCIPVRPGGQGQPSLPGYKVVPDSFVTVPLDEDLLIVQSAPSRQPTDDEINAKGSLFGTFVRTRRNISVRIRACAADGISQTELDSQLAIWKKKIERIWSSASSSGGQTLQIECDWVKTCSHYTITVYKNVNRAGMWWWSLTMDDDGADADAKYTSAHEFGHMLGLRDGYIYDGELPWLRDVIYNNTDVKAVAPTAYWPPTLIASLLPSMKDRAADRVANGQCSTGPQGQLFDIMQHENVKLNGVYREPYIPPELIDVIERINNSTEHSAQPLCWRKELF